MQVRDNNTERQLRILVVEDEISIQKLIKLNLAVEGYDVVCVDNGIDALKVFDSQNFDLLLLDIMLPEIDGFQICEQIRLKNKNIGIIFISAKDSPKDKIKGLKLGADDYLSKPFNLEELLLRVNNLARRSGAQPIIDIEEYQFGSNAINFNSYKAKGTKGEIELTSKEALLLKMLIEHKNEVISRKQILQNVWGYDIYPSTRTIDNFILSFRKYFEPDPKNPVYFHSVRGVGYMFEDK